MCILSILINITAYSWGYHDFDTINLMFFWFTIVDIIPIIAFSVPPNHFLAKLAPFYQDGDKDEPDQASSVEEGDSASNETSTN